MPVFNISEIQRTLAEVFCLDIQQNILKAHQGHSGAKNEMHILQRSQCKHLVIFYTRQFSRTTEMKCPLIQGTECRHLY